MANSIFGNNRTIQTGGEGNTLTGFMTMDERNFPGCIEKMGLSMSEADLGLCVDFFRDSEQRDPTMAELMMADCCRSEDMRHPAMDTVIDSVTCSDPSLERAYMDYLSARRFLGREKPVTLRDIAQMAERYLRGGLMPEDDVSGAAIDINAEINGEKEPWILHLSSSGDVLCGRAYPFAVMRLTAESEPRADDGCVKGSAACTGLADRIYHPGYGRHRTCADMVFAAAPAVNIRDEEPEAGDVVILLGGSAGKDRSAEEHRIQRFLRSATVSRMIKRTAVIGEGGIAAALCGLADGLEIDLDPVLEKDGGMFCVVSQGNAKMFEDRASDEDVSCMRAAAVTDGGRLVMQLGGEIIVDMPSDYLRAPCAVRHTDIEAEVPGDWQNTSMYEWRRNFTDSIHAVAREINTCSRRGLTESFDTSAGAGSVLMPFGGRNQLTPAQAMACRLPLERGESGDCTMAAWGFNPFIAKVSPYHAGYLAVVESAAKLIASGASLRDIFFCLHGIFSAPGKDPERWGRPLAAVLGAFEAQMGLRIGAVCMNEKWIEDEETGSLPPALISFAAAMTKDSETVSPEFREAGHRVIMLRPETDVDPGSACRGLPDPYSLVRVWETAHGMIASGEAVAAYTPGIGGIAEAVMKMSFGNGIGFCFDKETFLERDAAMHAVFGYSYGSIILELDEDAYVGELPVGMVELGRTTADQTIAFGDENVGIGDLLVTYEGRLESVFPVKAAGSSGRTENVDYRARSWHAPIYKRTEPRVLVPVFEGTGCETEAAKVIRAAGAVPGIITIRDRTLDEAERSAELFAGSLRDAQMVFIPGNIAGYRDESGSMTGFFRKEAVREGIMNLLEKHDGLICGTGSGFSTLLELGLVPYGRYAEEGEETARLTANIIGCHRSAIVRVRVASNKSAWLRLFKTGEVMSLPVSTAAGRFEASPGLLSHLEGAGQIATQYADLSGRASGDIRFDPCGSMHAVEGATSPDGRIFGRTGLAERCAGGLYRNVEGKYLGNMFEGAVQYFK